MFNDTCVIERTACVRWRITVFANVGEKVRSPVWRSLMHSRVSIDSELFMDDANHRFTFTQIWLPIVAQRARANRFVVKTFVEEFQRSRNNDSWKKNRGTKRKMLFATCTWSGVVKSQYTPTGCAVHPYGRGGGDSTWKDEKKKYGVTFFHPVLRFRDNRSRSLPRD